MLNEAGARVNVLLSIEDDRRLLEDLEELAGIRAYDAAKASGAECILFDQAVAEIEQRIYR